jgi:mono/diheme cytochrome c family protein
MSVSRVLTGPIVLLFLLAAAAPAARTVRPPTQETGREIFATVCATCHTVHPPPTKAPPMSNIARHYRAAASDTADAVALLADWIREPDADRSLLPADAIVTFGVMPSIGLGESRIDAVARYVLTLADSATGDGSGRGMGARAARNQEKA